MSILRSSTVFIVLLTFTATVRADIVFNNFGTNDQYDGTTGWAVGGLGVPLWEMGEPFRVNKSYMLDTIELAIGLNDGKNEFFLRLMDDDNGKPGKVVESFHVIGAMDIWVFNPPPVVIQSQNHPLLQVGQRYWVVAAASKGTSAIWGWNSTGDFGPHGHRTDRGEWQITLKTNGAFRVTGIPVD